MPQTYRRFSTEFKLGLIEAYLAGRGSIKRLATDAGINHSLLHYWLRKYERGELSVDLQHEEDLRESERKVAALERKVGQLTMELDLLKRGLIAVPEVRSGRSSIISGPEASPSAEGAR